MKIKVGPSNLDSNTTEIRVTGPCKAYLNSFDDSSKIIISLTEWTEPQTVCPSKINIQVDNIFNLYNEAGAPTSFQVERLKQFHTRLVRENDEAKEAYSSAPVDPAAHIRYSEASTALENFEFMLHEVFQTTFMRHPEKGA